METLSKLDEYRDFRDLNSANIARLHDEKRRLEAESDLLKVLTERLAAVQTELEKTEAGIKNKLGDISSLNAKREAAEALRAELAEAAADSRQRNTNTVKPAKTP